MLRMASFKRNNSTMSNKSSISGKSKSGSAGNDYYGRSASKADFQRILDVWRGNCARAGVQVSKPAVAEFKKRIGNAANKKEKAKLSLNGCQLNDRRAMLLIETLAMRPVISKLDLSDNDISNETARLILKLMKGQANLIKTIDIDRRLNVAFLGEVNLDDSHSSIDASLLKDIQMMAEVLDKSNAQAYIRSTFLELGLQEPVDTNMVDKIWTAIVGKVDKLTMMRAFTDAGMSTKRVSPLSYAELENLLLKGLTQRGSLMPLNDWQSSKVTPARDDAEEAKGDDWVEEQQSEAGDDTDDIAAGDGDGDDGSFGGMNSDDHEGNEGNEESETDARNEIKDGDGDAAAAAGTETEDDGASARSRRDIQSQSPKISKSSDPAAAAAAFSPTTATPLREKVNDDDADNQDSSNDQPRNWAIEKPDSEDVEEEQQTGPPVSTKVPTLPLPAAGDSKNAAASASKKTSGASKKKSLPKSRKSAPLPSSKGTANRSKPTKKVPAAKRQLDLRDLGIEQEEEDGEVEGEDKHVQARQQQKHLPKKTQTHTEPLELSPEQAPESTFVIVPPKELRRKKHTVLKVINAHSEPDIDYSILLDPVKFAPLEVLVLRNNNIRDVSGLDLHHRFGALLDLDLAYNNMTDVVPVMPATLRRLDLSHNRLTNVSGVLNCVMLEELNLAHNAIKTFHALPSGLTRLDLSYNEISHSTVLRSLALSPSVERFSIAGNPVVHHVPQWKVVLRTLLNSLVELDGKLLPRTKKNAVPSMKFHQNPQQQQQQQQRQQQQQQKHRSSAGTSPTRKKASHTMTVEEQKLRDAERVYMYEAKLAARQEAREMINRSQEATRPRIVLHPDEVADLTQRLTAPSKHAAPRAPPPEPEHIPVTNLHRKQTRSPARRKKRSSASPGPRNGGRSKSGDSATSAHLTGQDDGDAAVNQAQEEPRNDDVAAAATTEEDIDLGVWLSKSKLELSKAAVLMERATALALRAVVSAEDVKDFSTNLRRVDFYTNQDLPLAVENAINALESGNPLLKTIHTIRMHTDKVNILLHQTESAVLLSSKGSFKLGHSLHKLMNSGGRFASLTQILKLYGFDYEATALHPNNTNTTSSTPGSGTPAAAVETPFAASTSAVTANSNVEDEQQQPQQQQQRRPATTAESGEQVDALERMRNRLAIKALQYAADSMPASPMNNTSQAVAPPAPPVDEQPSEPETAPAPAPVAETMEPQVESASATPVAAVSAAQAEKEVANKATSSTFPAALEIEVELEVEDAVAVEEMGEGKNTQDTSPPLDAASNDSAAPAAPSVRELVSKVSKGSLPRLDSLIPSPAPSRSNDDSEGDRSVPPESAADGLKKLSAKERFLARMRGDKSAAGSSDKEPALAKVVSAAVSASGPNDKIQSASPSVSATASPSRITREKSATASGGASAVTTIDGITVPKLSSRFNSATRIGSGDSEEAAADAAAGAEAVDAEQVPPDATRTDEALADEEATDEPAPLPVSMKSNNLNKSMNMGNLYETKSTVQFEGTDYVDSVGSYSASNDLRSRDTGDNTSEPAIKPGQDATEQDDEAVAAWLASGSERQQTAQLDFGSAYDQQKSTVEFREEDLEGQVDDETLQKGDNKTDAMTNNPHSTVGNTANESTAKNGFESANPMAAGSPAHHQQQQSTKLGGGAGSTEAAGTDASGEISSPDRQQTAAIDFGGEYGKEASTFEFSNADVAAEAAAAVGGGPERQQTAVVDFGGEYGKESSMFEFSSADAAAPETAGSTERQETGTIDFGGEYGKASSKFEFNSDDAYDAPAAPAAPAAAAATESQQPTAGDAAPAADAAPVSSDAATAAAAFSDQAPSSRRASGKLSAKERLLARMASNRSNKP